MSFSISAVTATSAEGSVSPAGSFTFLVTRSGGAGLTQAVTWRVAGSGAAPADASDFSGASLPTGLLTFGPDETSRSLTFTTVPDTLGEADEGFTVTLSSPTDGATIATAAAGGVILNDDGPAGAGPGNDSLAGTAAAETIAGASGDDVVVAGGGADLVAGDGTGSYVVNGSFELSGSFTSFDSDRYRETAALTGWTIAGAPVVQQVRFGGSIAIPSDGSFAIDMDTNIDDLRLGQVVGGLEFGRTYRLFLDVATYGGGTSPAFVEVLFGGVSLGEVHADGTGNWHTAHLDLVAGSGNGDNLLEVRDGTSGSAIGIDNLRLLDQQQSADTLSGGAGADTILGGAGKDLFVATLAELNGDLLPDFSAGDVLRISGSSFTLAALGFSYAAGRTTIGIDADGNGTADASFALSGRVEGLLAVTGVAGGTEIRLATQSYGTHSYMVVTRPAGPLSWHDAAAEARALGGYLAVPTNALENAFIDGLVRATPGAYSVSGGFGPWLGGFQAAAGAEPAGGWRWLSGEAFAYTGWRGGDTPEPNDYQGVEDFLHYLNRDTQVGAWNDAPQNGQPPGATEALRAFVVEFDVDTSVQAGPTDGPDTLGGTAAADTLDGLGGNDLLTGLPGDDTLLGGAGSDTLDGREDNDVLMGGAGSDLSSALSGQDLLDEGGSDPGADTLQGGAGADTLLGGDGDDQLDGGADNDRIDGGAGNDLLVLAGNRSDYGVATIVGGFSITGLGGRAGDGADTVLGVERFGFADGERSADILLVAPLTPGSDSHLGTSGGDSVDGLAGADSLNGAGGQDSLLGGGGNDTLLGGAGADTLLGGTENDLLNGGIDNDLLNGGVGSDTLLGGDGADTLIAGAANDRVEGGNDTDLLVLAGARADFAVVTITGGLAITALGGLAPEGGDTVLGVERFAFTDGERGLDTILVTPLSSGADTFLGTTGGDTVDGLAGADSINASAGDDSLVGGAGNDTLLGGAGRDTLLGGGDSDLLNGGTENDLLDGGGGADTLLAGDGADTLAGGLGNDRIDGGNDADLLLLAGSRADFGISTIAGGYVVTGLGGLASEGADTVLGVERFGFTDGEVAAAALFGAPTIVGSDAAESLAGTASAEVINALGGADSIAAGGGADTLLGGAGADTLDGGTGADSLVGGADSDVYLVDDAGDVVVEAAGATGGAADLVRSSVTHALAANVERLVLLGTGGLGGTGNALANLITGTTGGNALSGLDGNDTLRGLAGADTLDGGLGADSLDGGDGDDLMILGGGGDTLDAGAGADTLSLAADFGADGVLFDLRGGLAITSAGVTSQALGVEVIASFAGAGGDTLLAGGAADSWSAGDGTDSADGGGGADTLRGDADADTLAGGAGADVLDGGAGADVAIFSGRRADYGVTTLAGGGFALVDLRSGSPDGADSVFGVEGFRFSDGSVAATGLLVPTGTPGNDSLAGTAGGDSIDALAGADTLSGAAGDDTLLGGDGNDVVQGGEGDDQLLGGGGDDEIAGGAGDDALLGGGGRDLAIYRDAAAGVVVDLALGEAQDGAGGIDALAGIEGAVGSAFDDLLRGDAGDNLFGASAGADTIEGGAGFDWLAVLDAADGVLVDLAAGLAVAPDGVMELAGIEAVVGSRLGDDLAGDAAANLLLGNEGDDTLQGAAGGDTLGGGLGKDRLNGGDGDDWLDGAEGADLMLGGAGGDTYVVTDLGDRVVEGATAGTDAILTTLAAYALGVRLETLAFVGSGAFAGTGNAAANVLAGGRGADTLRGLGGNDVLRGASGDVLEGGAGTDRFMLDGLGTVTVLDLDRGLRERIDLSAIDAVAATAADDLFRFIGNAAFTGAAGQLRWAELGASRRIEGDVDGDMVADVVILTGAAGPVTAAWFIL
jgi:Ca2+-binding RTX toxin-like protein